MVKADPSTLAFLDVANEGGLRGWCPVVRRIVELDEELVSREKCLVDGIGVFDVVDSEVVFSRQLVQPDLRRVDKGLVNSAVLGPLGLMFSCECCTVYQL